MIQSESAYLPPTNLHQNALHRPGERRWQTHLPPGWSLNGATAEGALRRCSGRGTPSSPTRRLRSARMHPASRNELSDHAQPHRNGAPTNGGGELGTWSALDDEGSRPGTSFQQFARSRSFLDRPVEGPNAPKASGSRSAREQTMTTFAGVSIAHGKSIVVSQVEAVGPANLRWRDPLFPLHTVWLWS